MSEVKIHVLDVGQASSTVVEFDDHCYGIVDCGGVKRDCETPVVRFFQEARERSGSMRILFLLITHLDMDHVNAVGALFSDADIERRIERVYCNDLAYRELLIAVKRAIKPGMGIAVNPRNHGAIHALTYLGNLIQKRSRKERDFHFECVAPEAANPDAYPVRLRIESVREDISIDLWAPSQRLRDEGMHIDRLAVQDMFRATFSGAEMEDWNTASIVLTINAAGRCILLAGDATRRTWEEILNRATEGSPGADVVVAWHHGARLGMKKTIDYDELVWRRVLSRRGKVVCISCGSANAYGHPHREAFEAIRGTGGQIYCTERRASLHDSGITLWKEDLATTLIRSMSKSSLRVEHEDSQCCGDIVVKIRPEQEIAVTCSTGGCTSKVTHENCCVLQQIESNIG